MRDLLVPGEAVTIPGELGSEGASPWDCLAARIPTVNGQRIFTGAVLPFRPDATEQLLSAFETMVKEAAKALRTKVRRAAATGRKKRQR